MQKLLLSRLQPQGKTSFILSKRVVIRTGDESDDWYGVFIFASQCPWNGESIHCNAQLEIAMSSMASPGPGLHEKMIVVYNVAGPISMVLKQVLFLVSKIYPYDSARQISLG